MASPDDAPISAWRLSDEHPVAFHEALEVWTSAAHDVLAEAARRYGAFVTQAELAARIQADTGIKAGGPVRTWIDDLLAGVTELCHEAGEPPLAAMCVRLDQSVGDAYVQVLQVAGLPRPDDLDMHAAVARFQCYQHFGAALPEGAGPELTPGVAERRRGRATAKVPTGPKTARPRAAARAATPRTTTPKAAKPKAQAKPEPRPPKLCPNCFTELSARGTCGYCW